jgi:hypothetical protein
MKSKEERDAVPARKISQLTGLYFFVSVLLLLIGGLLEINQQFQFHFPGSGLALIYMLCYAFAFVLLFSWLMQKSSRLQLKTFHLITLYCTCFLIYLVLAPKVFNIQESMLLFNQHKAHFIFHWISSVIIGIMIFRLAGYFRQSFSKTASLALWLLCAFIVSLLSIEVLLAVNFIFYNKSNPLPELERIYVKTVLPILWGLCSFAFMWIGMRYNFRNLRIISLTLFTIILAKLFIFDIRNIPVAGKIAAFFSLGVLLLIVSFMYQRLKKIIVDDSTSGSANAGNPVTTEDQSTLSR